MLVLIAAGLGSLGRRSTHPWASRMLAASGTPAERPADPKPDWPHSEVPEFHHGLSGVALAAAAMLTTASIARHHDTVELFAQLALLLLITVRIARLITVHRALAAPNGDGPTTDIARLSTEGEPEVGR